MPFGCLEGEEEALTKFCSVSPRADSVAWNPHKLLGAGLQCSALLLRDTSVRLPSSRTPASFALWSPSFSVLPRRNPGLNVLPLPSQLKPSSCDYPNPGFSSHEPSGLFFCAERFWLVVVVRGILDRIWEEVWC